jgi:hypothetical protein
MSKPIVREFLCEAQKRKQVRRDDLLLIASATRMKRTEVVSNPTNLRRWNDVARDPAESFEPDAALVEMVRDVVRNARRRCTPDQQRAVMQAVMLYCCCTLLDQMLEPLGDLSTQSNVLELFTETENENAEAISAIARDLQAPTAVNDVVAARECEKLADDAKRVATGLRARAQRAFDSAKQWASA